MTTLPLSLALHNLTCAQTGQRSYALAPKRDQVRTAPRRVRVPLQAPLFTASMMPARVVMRAGRVPPSWRRGRFV